MAVTATGSAELDVYGLRLRIEGDWPEVVEAVRQDFAWFEQRDATGVPEVTVAVRQEAPDPSRFGDVPQAFITTRNAVFQHGSQTIIDYFGRALAVYHRDRDLLELQGEDEHLVHEAAYLFLLSRIGRHLDGSGLMRVHGLGLSGRSGAVLILLPSGGGKTTLALRALRDPDAMLLSEDTPVLDRQGLVHPFPLRIGINVTDAALVPEGELRRIERLEYGPKLVLSLDAFRDRIRRTPQEVRHLVLGERTLNTGAELSALPRRAMIGPLLRDGVVGVGVAQMVEYVLQRGARDVFRQGGVAAGRARCCAAALAKADTWRLRLGRDADQNWSALGQLLR